MPNSVNTNVGAMVALQNLNATNADLMTVQNRINTGKKIASAKDNGAIWAIAQNQRATSGSLNAVKDSLQRSQSTVDVAIAGGEAVSDLLLQMKEKALAASDSSLDTASRTALNDDFNAMRDQIAKSVSNATFNGVNMISATGTSIAALANDDGSSKITVQAQDLSLAGIGLSTGSISTQTTAAAMIATVGTAITTVSTALSKMGTGSKSLGAHLTFVSKL
ncbi:MAG: flagellin, partial [Phenylobacterium sp.]|uniref:flagellin n=1 Tax=Phenylobacterium sp. TaxID=1871053 RepID=UPI00272F4C54